MAVAISAVLAAGMGASRSAAADGSGAGGSALGADGAVLQVIGIQRQGGKLLLSYTVAQHGGSGGAVSELSSYQSVPGSIGLSVLDPASGRVGDELGTAADCQCTRLPPVLQPGQQVTATTTLADPGGSSLDVVADGFQPIAGIPVSGNGTAGTQGVRQLKPRTQVLVMRSQQGAARVSSGRSGLQRIDLNTDVLFAFNSATLSAQAGASLQTAAARLKTQPLRRLGVYGHTDGKGSPGYNRTLSVQRARAVQAALGPLLGAGWTFDVQGFGETRPVAPETTASGADYPAGRALNRRVELSLLK